MPRNYTVRDKTTGESFTFNWAGPGKPTGFDVDKIGKERRESKAKIAEEQRISEEATKYNPLRSAALTVLAPFEPRAIYESGKTAVEGARELFATPEPEGGILGRKNIERLAGGTEKLVGGAMGASTPAMAVAAPLAIPLIGPVSEALHYAGGKVGEGIRSITPGPQHEPDSSLYHPEEITPRLTSVASQAAPLAAVGAVGGRLTRRRPEVVPEVTPVKQLPQLETRPQLRITDGLPTQRQITAPSVPENVVDIVNPPVRPQLPGRVQEFEPVPYESGSVIDMRPVEAPSPRRFVTDPHGRTVEASEAGESSTVISPIEELILQRRGEHLKPEDVQAINNVIDDVSLTQGERLQPGAVKFPPVVKQEQPVNLPFRQTVEENVPIVSEALEPTPRNLREQGIITPERDIYPQVESPIIQPVELGGKKPVQVEPTQPKAISPQIENVPEIPQKELSIREKIDLARQKAQPQAERRNPETRNDIETWLSLKKDIEQPLSSLPKEQQGQLRGEYLRDSTWHMQESKAPNPKDLIEAQKPAELTGERAQRLVTIKEAMKRLREKESQSSEEPLTWKTAKTLEQRNKLRLQERASAFKEAAEDVRNKVPIESSISEYSKSLDTIDVNSGLSIRTVVRKGLKEGLDPEDIADDLASAGLAEGKASKVVQREARQMGITLRSGFDPIEAGREVYKLGSDIVSGVKEHVKQSDVRKSAVRVGKDLFAESLRAGINKQGPSSQEIVRLLDRARTRGNMLAGGWIMDVRKAAKGLTSKEYETMVDIIEGKTKSNDPRLNNAARRVSEVLDRVGDLGETSNLKLLFSSGNKLPFKKRKNYYPHVYDKSFWSKLNNKQDFNSAVDMIMKERAKIGKPISLQEATKILTSSIKRREQISRGEHAREFNLPGWKKDLSSLEKHLTEMGKRIARAQELGAEDVASINTPISKLIEKVSSEGGDSALVKRNIMRILERDNIPSHEATVISKAVQTYMTTTKLQRMAIGNLNQLARIPLRTNSKSFTKALVNQLKDTDKFYEDAFRSGATIGSSTMHAELSDSIMSNLIARAYNIPQTETFLRATASGAGKGTAITNLEALKNNPRSRNAPKLRKQLEDLILENPDEAIKRGYLTEEQLKMAGGRAAEITQGLADAIDLPYYWTGSPFARIYFTFKKYAFRDNVILRDAIKQNPAKSLAIILTMNQLMGEITGDAKEGVRGGATAGLEGDDILEGATERIKDRGEFATLKLIKGEQVDIENLDDLFKIREFRNLNDSWMFGLAGDALSAFMRGQYGMLQFGAGAVGSDAASKISAVSSAVKGDPKPLGREALRSLPIPYVGGYPVQEALLPVRRWD